MNLIKHRNTWNWGESVVCVTDNGYGIGTVSFVTEYEFDEKTDSFHKVKCAVISGISVYHTMRNLGYGNLILEACENEAIKHGYNEVSLWADPNSEAYKWYKRHGYEETNEMQIVPCGNTVDNEAAAGAELDPDTAPVVKLTKTFPSLESFFEMR